MVAVPVDGCQLVDKPPMSQRSDRHQRTWRSPGMLGSVERPKDGGGQAFSGSVSHTAAVVMIGDRDRWCRSNRGCRAFAADIRPPGWPPRPSRGAVVIHRSRRRRGRRRRFLAVLRVVVDAAAATATCWTPCRAISPGSCLPGAGRWLRGVRHVDPGLVERSYESATVDDGVGGSHLRSDVDRRGGGVVFGPSTAVPP